ncbi:MAG: hypothetical protein HRU03_07010 [Nanoarchaeales archaeon]|nr:hypothetical protein [Nanoarchaeales archaeon]
MKYLKEKLKKNTLPNFEELNRQELVDVITRTTLILQNFVYWEAIILKKNETPDKIKELLLNDINEEISDLNNGAHTTLGEKFRTEIIEKKVI